MSSSQANQIIQLIVSGDNSTLVPETVSNAIGRLSKMERILLINVLVQSIYQELPGHSGRNMDAAVVSGYSVSTSYHLHRQLTVLG